MSSEVAPRTKPGDAIKTLEVKYNKYMEKFPQVGSVADAVGLSPWLMTVYPLGVLAIFMMTGFGMQSFSNVIGTAYPAYCSFKVLERHARGQDYDEFKYLLTYWSVFGTLLTLEALAGFLVNAIPFWYFWRTLFLFFCIFPRTFFASFIYSRVVAPTLHRYEQQVDSMVESVSTAATPVATAAVPVVQAVLSRVPLPEDALLKQVSLSKVD